MARALILLLALGLLATACTPIKKTSALGMSQPVTEYRLEAKQFGFAPNEIRVPAGQSIRLIVTSADVDHRLAISGLVPDREAIQGRQQTIDLLAWPPGTYPFQCAVVCGTSHGQMTGSLVVE